MRAEHSRALLLAAAATDTPTTELQRRLDSAAVAISVDRDMPHSALTARVLITTLRRGPGNLSLIRDNLAEATIEMLQAASAAIDPTRPLQVTTNADRATVRVHIGPHAAGRVIRLVPEGCGAHVVTDPAALITPAQPGNPLGAIYTAALGAAEIFKHTAQVTARRRIYHQHLQFCPVTLSTNLSNSPALATTMTFRLTLIGIGAIGTATALILSELNAEGHILAVDRQHYALENRGTYSLGGDAETRSKPWKTDLAKQTLSRFTVATFPNDIDALIAAVDAGRAPWFSTVLTGLDSPEARRDAQRLWPDRLIDAATGDTMLGVHYHRYGIDPCMMCHFPVRTDLPSGTDRIADELGLPPHVLAEAVLAEHHLTGMSPAQRRRLAPHLGTPMCGLARATGLTELEAGTFMPSIPFVSMQAACLAIGRLIADGLNINAPGNLIQYDSLIGPHTATIETMRVRTQCGCTSRANAISHVRQNRAAKIASV